MKASKFTLHAGNREKDGLLGRRELRQVQTPAAESNAAPHMMAYSRQPALRVRFTAGDAFFVATGPKSGNEAQSVGSEESRGCAWALACRSLC